MICLNPCSNGRYSQSHNKWEGKYKGGWVLILVLMEDTLRVVVVLFMILNTLVLILVLMEDTLRVTRFEL